MFKIGNVVCPTLLCEQMPSSLKNIIVTEISNIS